MNDLHTKSNRKTLFVGRGRQINSIVTTYPGQIAFCTETENGFTADNYYKRDSTNTSWTEGHKTETDELSTTPVTDDAESTSSIATNRYYAYITLPTTSKFYIFTKLEWKNGTVVNGNIIAGIDAPMSAIPETLANTQLAGICAETAQAGTSTTQSSSVVSCFPIKGGSICGIWVMSNSATARLRWLEGQGSANYAKSTTYTTSPANINSESWVGSTVRMYIKAYYRGYM